MLATTTGTGWLDSSAVDSLEYLWNGDTAIAGVQYSYLPSWISLLADQDAVKLTSSTVFKTVYDYWSSLPQQDRPRLYLYGLSLGSFGVESVLGSVDIVNEPIDGALMVGPPFVNPHARRPRGRAGPRQPRVVTRGLERTNGPVHHRDERPRRPRGAVGPHAPGLPPARLRPRGLLLARPRVEQARLAAARATGTRRLRAHDLVPPRHAVADAARPARGGKRRPTATVTCTPIRANVQSWAAVTNAPGWTLRRHREADLTHGGTTGHAQVPASTNWETDDAS